MGQRSGLSARGGEASLLRGSDIDIDIPTGLNEKRTQPSDVKAATMAALEAGAPGVVLSRKYAEMKLSNIAGAKEALQNFDAL